MKKLHTLILGAAALVVVSSAQAQLLANGGFEQPDLNGGIQFFSSDTDNFVTNWTSTSPFTSGANQSDGLASNSSVPGVAHSGDQGVFFAPSVDVSFFEQTFATQPGSHYSLSFWLANGLFGGVGGQGEFFSASIDDFNTVLLDINPTGTFQYTEFSVEFTASAPTTTLKFATFNQSDFWYLDDVSVVPEPGTFALLGIGFLGMGSFRKDSKKA